MKLDNIGDRPESWAAKYLRISTQLYSGDPNEHIYHKKLGARDEIHEKLEGLRETNPAFIDGGVYVVDPHAKSITVTQGSTGYRIPVKGTETAEDTLEAFRAIAPGFLVWLADGGDSYDW